MTNSHLPPWFWGDGPGFERGFEACRDLPQPKLTSKVAPALNENGFGSCNLLSSKKPISRRFQTDASFRSEKKQFAHHEEPAIVLEVHRAIEHLLGCVEIHDRLSELSRMNMGSGPVEARFQPIRVIREGLAQLFGRGWPWRCRARWRGI